MRGNALIAFFMTAQVPVGLEHTDQHVPGLGIYGPMFAALSSLPHLQSLKLGRSNLMTMSIGALPGLDAISALKAPRLTELETDVRLSRLQVAY